MRGNAILLLVAQCINYAIPVLTFPYLARVLGVENFGQYGFVFSVVAYMCLLVDYGFNIGASKKISEAMAKGHSVNEIFWATWIAKFAIFIVVFGLIVVGGGYWLTATEYKLTLLAGMQVLGSVFYVNWYFQAAGTIGRAAVMQMGCRLFSVPAIIAFVNGPNDLLLAVSIQAGSVLLGAVLAASLLTRDPRIENIKIVPGEGVLVQLRDSRAFFLGALAISFYTSSSLILIKYFGSSQDLGVYNAADKIKMAFLGIFLVFGGVFFPHVSRLYVTNQELAYKFVKKLLSISLLASVSIALVICIFSAELVDLVLGMEYKSAANVLRILVIALPLILSSVLLCNYILVPNGHKTLYYVIPMVTGGVYLGLSIGAIVKYGAYGAAIASVISELIGCLIFLYFVVTKGYLRKVLNS